MAWKKSPVAKTNELNNWPPPLLVSCSILYHSHCEAGQGGTPIIQIPNKDILTEYYIRLNVNSFSYAKSCSFGSLHFLNHQMFVEAQKVLKNFTVIFVNKENIFAQRGLLCKYCRNSIFWPYKQNNTVTSLPSPVVAEITETSLKY